MSKYSGKTVREILEDKQGSIKTAALDPGSPSWDEILDLTWDEIHERAKKRKTGYKTLKKLITSREYDK